MSVYFPILITVFTFGYPFEYKFDVYICLPVVTLKGTGLNISYFFYPS